MEQKEISDIVKYGLSRVEHEEIRKFVGSGGDDIHVKLMLHNAYLERMLDEATKGLDLIVSKTYGDEAEVALAAANALNAISVRKWR